MSSIAPQIGASKGTGAKEVATGVYVDDGDLILSVGEQNHVSIDETSFTIQRLDGGIVIFDGAIEIAYQAVD